MSANVFSQALFHTYVNQNPELQADAGENLTICQGDSIEIGGLPTAIGGSSEYFFDWYPNENINDVTLENPVIYPNENIMYYVTVIDAHGCSKNDSVQITVLESPSIDFGTDLEFCEGETTDLDAGTGFETYEWSTGVTIQTITVSESGTYSVTVTDENGCSGNDEILVTIHENPVVDLGDDIIQNDSVILDAGPGFTEYLWSEESTSQEITVTETGTYSVIVTNEYGCIGSDTINVEIITSIFKGDHPQNISIQIVPNPNTGQFNLLVNNMKGEFSLEILNVFGQLLFHENMKNATGNLNKEITLLNDKAGMYYLKIIGKNYYFVKKFIVNQ